MGKVRYLGFFLIIAFYVFYTGGLSLRTVVLFLGWTMAGMGLFATIGGMKKEGIIAIVVGILISNLPNLL